MHGFSVQYTHAFNFVYVVTGILDFKTLFCSVKLCFVAYSVNIIKYTTVNIWNVFYLISSMYSMRVYWICYCIPLCWIYPIILNALYWIYCIKFLRFHSILYAIILNAFSSTECILFNQIRNSNCSFFSNECYSILYVFF